MDLTPTLEAKSDQLDAVDIPIGARRIFTITKVTKGNADQPANLHLAEFPRPYRPGKNMRRVLSGCWGADTDKWPTDAQIELYTDPEVMFAGVAVGGLRISRLSHIDGQQKIPLILTKGKSVVWKVDPLPEPTKAQTKAPSRVDALREEWHTADPSRQAEIQVEVEALRNEAAS